MNEAPNIVKFYASNTKLRSNSEALVSLDALTTLTDLVSCTVGFWNINYDEVNEGDVLDGAGGFRVDTGRQRGTFTMQSDYFYTDSDMTAYFNVQKVFRKRNRYMQIINSDIAEYLTNTELFGTTLQAISITVPDRETTHESGLKYIDFVIEKDRSV